MPARCLWVLMGLGGLVTACAAARTTPADARSDGRSEAPAPERDGGREAQPAEAPPDVAESDRAEVLLDASGSDARRDATVALDGRPAVDAAVDAVSRPEVAPAPGPGPDRTVTVFDKAHVFFGGGHDARNVYGTATFPAGGTYQAITMTLTLGCPAGGRDPWDRLGSLALVEKRDAGDPGRDQLLELGRFATPYGIGGTWTYDVTDLRPALAGPRELRIFIDTWVDGWVATVTFDMKGGKPAREPLFVLPLWSQARVGYGVPAHAAASDAPTRTLTLPQPVSGLSLRAIVTGHGQGNLDNCAEFCPKNHFFKVQAASHTQRVWRDDCETSAVPNQNGTWKYPRAGWCPGADVRTLTMDVGADVSAAARAGAAAFNVGYDVEAYDNTCRPDNCVSSSCALGTGCGFDTGNHTDPYYAVSAVLIGYR